MRGRIFRQGVDDRNKWSIQATRRRACSKCSGCSTLEGEVRFGSVIPASVRADKIEQAEVRVLEKTGLALLICGMILLGVGVNLSVVCRKAGVPLWKWIAAGSALVSHPEQYMEEDAARRFRRVFVVALAMMATGAIVAFLAGYV
jgi:hypothetical protein